MPIGPAAQIGDLVEDEIEQTSYLSSQEVDEKRDALASRRKVDEGVYAQHIKDPDKESPFSIYFFYIRINELGDLVADHYFYVDGPPDDPTKWKRILYGDVASKIEFLAKNARPGVHNPVALPDHNFANIKFRRKSYVAFFLDERNWSFHRRQAQGGRFAIIFNERKAKGKNYSFFDAMDVSFLMENSDGGSSIRTGVVLINHMWDENGNDLKPNATQKFAFDMYFDVKFVEQSNQRLVVIFDPGGDNEGPPEKP